jgi:hypothetical protein
MATSRCGEAAARLVCVLALQITITWVLRAVFICLLHGAAKWYGGREVWILGL